MKPTLVVSSGGLKGAYIAGFLIGLFRLGILANYFREIFGTSAGACASTYYATGQGLEGERIFKIHLPKKYVRWWYGTDMRYLERIFREAEKLDVKALAACPTKVHMSVTDVVTKQARAICLNDAADPIDVMLAGVSWSKPRPLDGVLYADGGFSAQTPLRLAEQAGAKKIWVLSAEAHGHRLSHAPWKAVSLLLAHRPHMSRLFAQLAASHNRILREIEERNDIVVIRPKTPLPIDIRGTNPEAVSAAFDLGVQTAFMFVKERKHEL